MMAEFHCLTDECPARAEGTQRAVERAAEKHTKETGHATSTCYPKPAS